MLTVMISVLISGIRDPPTKCALLDPPRTGLGTTRHPIPLEVRAEFLFTRLKRLGGSNRHLDLDGVVLAQRKTLPVLGHQQPPRIRMAVERDAEHVHHLALQP